MTDQELQLALAKMLPDKLSIVNTGDAFEAKWKVADYGKGFLMETEWLHVCWLIEQELDVLLRPLYVNELWYIVGEHFSHGTNREFLCISASWQQRAQALIKVKGN